jgi:hypothetical protein
MDQTLAFRRLLAGRIFQAALLTIPVAPLAACGTGVAGDAGAGAGNGDYQLETGACFAWPDTGTGGAGGGGGAGGMGGATTGSGGMGGATASSGGDAALSCPQPEMAPATWTPIKNVSPSEAVFVDNQKPNANGLCCYTISRFMTTGRPFVVEEQMRTAPVGATAGQAWQDAGATPPRTGDLTSEQRASLAAAWTRDGLFEHASIASFGRFALELLAVGAPSDLLERAHRAAIDEVHHARLCLALASAYAGATVAPASFPFDGRVEVDSSLASVAARAAREGCIGETLAAVQAAEQLARAEDPAVRAVLAVIAEDEARHAELAWRTVAWAVRTGGEEVRLAVAAVFAEISEPAPAITSAGEAEAMSAALRAHGRLSEAEVQATVARALLDIVLPSARALLAIDVG